MSDRLGSAAPFATSLATWFGCGFSPVAPGTAGSLGALAMAWVVEYYWPLPPAWWLIPAAILVLPGIWAGGVVARARGLKDPGLVVVDEVVGQWITLAGAKVLNWKTWLAAFLLFRALDIWKPFPARQFERFPGGVGIMADDVMAGIYGALVLFIAGCFNLY
jgi:phosphatidylglycerophosphatase A